jgi:hypothetical protein
MKKLLFACAAGLMLSGCAMVQSPVPGMLYQDVKSPVAVTSNSGSSKVGTATVSTILGLVATGDVSVETAAKSAGITKIHHVDQHSTCILGVYGTYTITVYGE